jgi:hypothetical protein
MAPSTLTAMSDPLGGAHVETTATPRSGRVARMLLRFAQIALFSAMSACVLPVGPEFQDPPGAANASPIIVEATPDIGMRVTGNSMDTFTFSLTVTDPNPGDTLHVRWLADYPPFSATNTRLLQEDTVPASTTGMPQQTSVSRPIGCRTSPLSALPSHQVMAIVADRPFLPSLPPPAPVDYGRLPPDGLKVVAVWILDVECFGGP